MTRSLQKLAPRRSRRRTAALNFTHRLQGTANMSDALFYKECEDFLSQVERELDERSDFISSETRSPKEYRWSNRYRRDIRKRFHDFASEMMRESCFTIGRRKRSEELRGIYEEAFEMIDDLA